MGDMTAGSAWPTSTTGATPPDRRTRARERRHNEVYEAAVALITEKGFENTTMDDIAERADIARATVFNHFARKTAILDEWSARRRQTAIEAVNADHLEHSSVRAILHRYVIELAEISNRTRAETVALMGAAVHTTNVLGHPALAGALGSMLEQARHDGRLAPGVDLQLGGLLLASGYFAILSAWIGEEPAPFDLRTRLVSMVDIVLDGILAGSRQGPGADG